MKLGQFVQINSSLKNERRMMLYLVGLPLYAMGAACYMGVMNSIDQKYHFTDPIIFLVMCGALVWPVILLPALYFAIIMCGCYYTTKYSAKIGAKFLRKFFP
jgi:uncharacterized membrane protein YidH (DUF202 family)